MNADQEPRNAPTASDGSDATRDHFGTRPDETELSDRLTAIADRHVPVPDWGDVVHRAESPPSIPLHRVGAGSGGGRRPFGRSTLAVAAALIVVIGAVGTFMATRGEDESVESGPAGPDDVELIDTGWYIPSPLPDGWKVTSIEASDLNLVGPGLVTIWTKPDDSASLSYASEPADGWSDTRGDPVDLGNGITAYRQGGGTPFRNGIIWVQDDQLRVLEGVNLADREMEAAARAMATDPERTESPVPGLELLDQWVRTFTDRTIPLVTITVTSAGGHDVAYQLSPSGVDAASYLLGSIPTERRIEGQPFPVLEPVDSGRNPNAHRQYLGLWPGADVRLDVSGEVDPAKALSPRSDVDDLLRSLRPATTEEWRSFVRDTGLEVDQRLLAAEQLGDITARNDGDPEQPGGADGDAPLRDGVPEGLQFISEASDPNSPVLNTVASGATLNWSVAAQNISGRPMEITQCFLARSGSALVPASAPVEATSRSGDVSCDPEAVALVLAPGERVALPMSRHAATGTPAREVVHPGSSDEFLGGTLPPGQYRAEFWTTRNGYLTASYDVEVTEHPCGGFDTEFVVWFLGLAVDQAEARAAEAGMTLRVVEIDGVRQEVTEDHRCDRANVGVNLNGAVESVIDVG